MKRFKSDIVINLSIIFTIILSTMLITSIVCNQINNEYRYLYFYCRQDNAVYNTSYQSQNNIIEWYELTCQDLQSDIYECQHWLNRCARDYEHCIMFRDETEIIPELEVTK